MKIGVARERAEGERRVALTPDAVERLVKKGHAIAVQSGAGIGSMADDTAYRARGADIVADFAALAAWADIVVKIQPPTADEIAVLRRGQILVAQLQPLVQPERMQQLAAAGVTAFSLDAMPRITRAQGMDVLSSQATVAGYRAVLVAATLLPKLFPLLMTAAGTIAPARVLVLGAGVAGLQAVATAKRLGALVQAFDTRPAVKEQVESLGASFLTLPLEVAQAETTGGYARKLEADLEAQERDLLRQPVAQADVVITTAMVPGSRAPLLIDQPMVEAMRPGSVIVDLAAEAGGNCQLTEAGRRVVTPNGVVIEGSTNLPAQVPVHASQLYAHNLQTFLALLIEQGLGPKGEPEAAATGEWTVEVESDEILKATCITRSGEVVHPPTAARLSRQGVEA